MREMNKPRMTTRPWLPLVGSAFVIALAFFTLPSILAIDLKDDRSARLSGECSSGRQDDHR
jgi:hypothetical protein